MILRILWCPIVLLLLWNCSAQAGSVLDRVKAADRLSCGVLVEPEDYGKSDVHGGLDEFGSDLCHALAAAVLGDAAKASFASLSDEAHGFAAVRNGTIDVLFGASPSSEMSVVYGLRFGSPVWFDGTGLLVPAESGLASFGDLAGKQVCFIANTPAEGILDSESARRNIKVLPFPFEEEGEMNFALLAGHCDAIISSVSRLANARAGFHGRYKDFIILPDRLSVDPVSPAVQDRDAQWAAVVGAVMNAPVLAESGGINGASAERLRTTQDPMLRGLAGFMPGIDQKLIDRDWAIRAIRAVGNFAEIYDRDFGPNSPLALPRGFNALWSQGGLILPNALR